MLLSECVCQSFDSIDRVIQCYDMMVPFATGLFAVVPVASIVLITRLVDGNDQPLFDDSVNFPAP